MKFLINGAVFASILALFILFDSDGIAESLNGRLAGNMLRFQEAHISKENFFLNGYLNTPKELNEYYRTNAEIGSWNSIRNFEFNLFAYKNYIDVPEDSDWTYYLSAVRSQFFLATTMDFLIYTSTGRHDNAQIVNTLDSTLSVLAFSIFLLWIKYELGIYTSILTLLLSLASQDLFNFGSFYAYWQVFGTLCLSLFFYRNAFKSKATLKTFLTIYLIYIFAFLRSYEAVPTLIVMILSPSFYYAFIYRSKFKFVLFLTVKHFLIIISSFISTLIIHLVLVSIYLGSIKETIVFFNQRLVMRTYNISATVYSSLSEKHKAATDASLWDVLIKFSQSSDGLFYIKEYYLLLISLLIALIIFLLHRFNIIEISNRISQFYGLLCMLVVCYFGALARPIIFKAHAVQPAHLEFITDSFKYSFIPVVVLFISYIIVNLFEMLSCKILNKIH